MKKALFVALIIVSTLATALIAEDLVSFGNDAVLDADRTVENAVVFGGTLTVKGKVLENAVVFGGNLVLDPGASVGENAVCFGGSVTRDNDATVAGSVINPIQSQCCPAKPSFPKFSSLFFRAIRIASILAALAGIVLFVLTAAIFPNFISGLRSVLDASFGKSLLWGFIASVCLPPLCLLLLVTIVGIPALLLLLCAMIPVGIVSMTAISAFVGQRVLGGMMKTAPGLVLSVLVGAFLIVLVKFAPFAGALVALLACLAGFGSFILWLASRKKGG
jgi:hypothetical protein